MDIQELLFNLCLNLLPVQRAWRPLRTGPNTMTSRKPFVKQMVRFIHRIQRLFHAFLFWLSISVQSLLWHIFSICTCINFLMCSLHDEKVKGMCSSLQTLAVLFIGQMCCCQSGDKIRPLILQWKLICFVLRCDLFCSV